MIMKFKLEPAECPISVLIYSHFFEIHTLTKRMTFHLLQGVAIWQQKHI